VEWPFGDPPPFQPGPRPQPASQATLFGNGGVVLGGQPPQLPSVPPPFFGNSNAAGTSAHAQRVEAAVPTSQQPLSAAPVNASEPSTTQRYSTFPDVAGGSKRSREEQTVFGGSSPEHKVRRLEEADPFSLSVADIERLERATRAREAQCNSIEAQLRHRNLLERYERL